MHEAVFKLTTIQQHLIICIKTLGIRFCAHTSDGLCLLQIALDLINPQLVLPTVIPHMHHGAVCAVYLAKCVSPLFHCHLSNLRRMRLNEVAYVEL